jgi:hypothetical protein
MHRTKGEKQIKRNKLKYIAIALSAVILLFALSVYTEFNGYPWKHGEIKREAVGYMKSKYNMDVKVVGSSFNFKFDYYTAKVYDVNDTDKSIIRVEKQRFYDENTQGRGERLEDDYCKVYWENRINNEIREKYPEFCSHEDIEKINADISYSTAPMGEGVSSDRDVNGVLIPLRPELDGILDVDLKTQDFSDDFLNELLLLINDLGASQIRVNLFVTGKNEEADTGGNRTRTKLIDIEWDKYGDIKSIEALKEIIRDF